MVLRVGSLAVARFGIKFREGVFAQKLSETLILCHNIFCVKRLPSKSSGQWHYNGSERCVGHSNLHTT
jgi:hypothetical protein